VNDRTRHINYQNACRRLYHAWSTNSVDIPTEFLCIIHDKMDHMKTAIPRMQRHTKATAGLGQIPISLIGMLTHGHGDGAYAHYVTAFWPGDSNFTISSICRVLWALERPPVREWKVLSSAPRRTRSLKLSCMVNRGACPRFLTQIVIPLLLRFREASGSTATEVIPPAR
jgi:hypothetical protein